jgi:proton-dependent oligopeptide transporter, POT family
VGSIGSIATVYSEKYVGFWLAYLLPTIVYFLIPIVLWAGYSRYVRTPPKGSILLQAFHVIRLSYKGVWCKFPLESLPLIMSLIEIPKAFNPIRFWSSPVNWDNARPIVAGKKSSNPIINWDSEFVDEIRRSLWACKVL